MTSTKKDPVVVVLQLTGCNDYYNTIIPYNSKQISAAKYEDRKRS